MLRKRDWLKLSLGYTAYFACLLVAASYAAPLFAADVSATWKQPDGADGWQVQYRTVTGNPPVTGTWTTGNTVQVTADSFSLPDLKPGDGVDVRVRAFNEKADGTLAWGAWSDPARGTLPMVEVLPPNAPIDVGVTVTVNVNVSTSK